MKSQVAAGEGVSRQQRETRIQVGTVDPIRYSLDNIKRYMSENRTLDNMHPG